MPSNMLGGEPPLPELPKQPEHSEFTLFSWSGRLSYEQETKLIELVERECLSRRGTLPSKQPLYLTERMMLMELCTNARVHAHSHQGPPQVALQARLYRNGAFEFTATNYINSSQRSALEHRLQYSMRLTAEQRMEQIRARMRVQGDDGHRGARLGLLGAGAWAEVCWRFTPYDKNHTIFSIRLRAFGGKRRCVMRTLNIQQTKYTPLISYDPNERVFTMRGVSRPQNTVEFFRPIMAWVVEFVQEERGRGITPEPCKLVFDLDYFNSVTSKYIMEIIMKIQQLYSQSEGLSIIWYYPGGDEENRSVGEDMAYISGMSFNMVER